MHFDPQTGVVLLIDKPLEWTSFDVVNKLRYAFLRRLHAEAESLPGEKKKIKVKVGHAGTLDPLATGLLIVCAGKETKNIDSYMATEKEYTGSIVLGATTPSYDKETEVDVRFPIEHITPDLIQQTARSFIGPQLQMPPMFSAIKKDGKKLYDSAREGKSVDIEPRPIEILEFEITAIQLPEVHFRVVCSKGTYIRSLAFDFGKAMNSGAYLGSLCRTRSGNFQLKDARSVNQCLEDIAVIG